jgi:hypothetical protein
MLRALGFGGYLAVPINDLKSELSDEATSLVRQKPRHLLVFGVKAGYLGDFGSGGHPVLRRGIYRERCSRLAQVRPGQDAVYRARQSLGKWLQ